MIRHPVGGLGKRLQHIPPVIVEDHDATLFALRVSHRRCHAQHRLIGHLDLVLLDIQIHGRNKDLARIELHGVDEKIALALVLQLFWGDHKLLALHVIDPNDLHTRLVDPAQLVVDSLSARKTGKILGQAIEIRLAWIIDRITQSTVTCQKKQITTDFFGPPVQRPGTQTDIEPLLAFQVNQFTLNLGQPIKVDSGKHQNQERAKKAKKQGNAMLIRHGMQS